MSNRPETYASVWDEIAKTSEQAANLRARECRLAGHRLNAGPLTDPLVIHRTEHCLSSPGVTSQPPAQPETRPLSTVFPVLIF